MKLIKELKNIAVFILCLHNISGYSVYAQDPLPVELLRVKDNWIDIALPKVKSPTIFSLEPSKNLLTIKTDNSGSLYLLKTIFSSSIATKFSWEWQTEKVFQNWKEGSKSHDDFPLRLFFIFYDQKPTEINQQKTITWRSIQPDSALAYIWTPRETSSEFIPSPYTKIVQMKALQTAFINSFAWAPESVQLDQDYQKAFHDKIPPFFRISIISDSDNLAENNTAKIKNLTMEGPVAPGL